MNENEFLIQAEQALLDAAAQGRAGLRFVVPREAKRYWEEFDGITAEFLRWLVVHQAQFEVLPDPRSTSTWVVDVGVEGFAEVSPNHFAPL
jgi:hypothetical protein